MTMQNIVIGGEEDARYGFNEGDRVEMILRMIANDHPIIVRGVIGKICEECYFLKDPKWRMHNYSNLEFGGTMGRVLKADILLMYTLEPEIAQACDR